MFVIVVSFLFSSLPSPGHRSLNYHHLCRVRRRDDRPPRRWTSVTVASQDTMNDDGRRLCVFVCVRTSVCSRVCIHVYVRVSPLVYTYVFCVLHKCVCGYVCVCVRIYVYIHSCLYVFIRGVSVSLCVRVWTCVCTLVCNTYGRVLYSMQR